MNDLSLSLASGPPRPRVSARRLAVALAASLAAALLAGCAVQTSQAAQPQNPSGPLASATPAPLPDPGLLTAKLAQVSTKNITKTSILVSTPDGAVLANRLGATPLTPASTMKLVTTMAAVDLMGAERTFATRVTEDSQGGLVLIGGGDPLLTDKTSSSIYKLASLQRLAKDTVTALNAAGRTEVSLGYDASLFTGPSFSPYWKKNWKGYEAKVAALEINSGKLNSWRADPNPPKTAATAFAKRLRAAGIKVTSIMPAKAAATSAEVARVTSTTLAMIIKRTLLVSDNVAAETLSRQASLAAGHAGSFSSAAANVTSWLTARGLWVPGQKILDASGLSPSNKLTTQGLTAAMRTALADDTFTPIIAGLPVAWETGTLAKRFNDKSEMAGRHIVHAKTGTLKGVAGLVGYLTTTDGSLLVFAELANSSKPVGYNTLYNWLDRTAAATISCGCR
jgi:serine-type D-Ala-D-Ala carboxypeptidase/endopeptidase (penicillin-binding protein 4)